MLRYVLLLALTLVFLGTPSGALGAAFADLGSTSAGGPAVGDFNPAAVNSGGVVVGSRIVSLAACSSSVGGNATRWRPDAGFAVIIPNATRSSAAYDINDSGDIVGAFDTVDGCTDRAAFHSVNGANPTDLGEPGGAIQYGAALGINASGRTVGFTGYSSAACDATGTEFADLGTNCPQATSWTPATKRAGANDQEWMMRAISDTGRVVGLRYSASASTGMTWPTEGGAPGALDNLTPREHGISPNGNLIVGSTSSAINRQPRLLDVAAGAYTDLQLTGDASGGMAFAVNDAEQIVGEVTVAGSTRAVIWRNRYAKPQLLGAIAPAGWLLTRAFDIAPDGHVVGTGTLHGVPHAWTAKVVPRTITGSAVTTTDAAAGGATVSARSPAGDAVTASVSAADPAYKLHVLDASYEVSTADGASNSYFPANRTAPTTTADQEEQDFRIGCQVENPELGVGASGRSAWKNWITTDTNYGCVKIEWEMQSRETRWETPTSVQEAQSAYYPKQWPVRLLLVYSDPDILRYCNDKTYQWEWWVQPVAGGEKVKQSKLGCQIDITVPKLGAYNVWAVQLKVKKDGSLVRTGNEMRREIIAQNLMIVAGGDSNSSGEGNPPFFNAKCNRSKKSYQYRTVEELEKRDHHTSVSLLFLGCSGAQTRHMWRDSYAGINPKGAAEPPQFAQIHKLLTPPNGQTRRQIHALLLSIGVNDVLFGADILICVKAPRCTYKTTKYKLSPAGGDFTFERMSGRAQRATKVTKGVGSPMTLKQVFDNRAAQLPTRYAQVNSKLSMMGPQQKKRVFLAQYPDFTYNEKGQPCGAFNPPFFSKPTWSFFRVAGTELNQIGNGTKKLGWSLSPGVSALYHKHGYCAGGSSWFASLTGSLGRLIWDTDTPIPVNFQGSFHPDFLGPVYTADLTADNVCGSLYGNTGCKGLNFPRP